MKYLLFIPILILASCARKSAEKPKPEPRPVIVKTTLVAVESWPAIYEATGTVRARVTSAISAKTMGFLREVRVQPGDRVAAGQLLAVVEARELEAGVERAQAAVREARDAGPEAENAVAAAKANLGLAEATFRRMKDLFEKKSISNQEYDEASAKLEAAQAAHRMAAARTAQVRARIAQAEQAQREAEISRGYTRVEAPFAGLVVARHAEPGVLATPGSPLVTIEREGGYRLEAAVEESRIAAIRNGQNVAVRIDALDRTLNARVGEIVPAVDAAARSYLVKLDLPAAPQLRSGMFGRALFALGSRPVVAAPASAIRQNGQLQSVTVAEDGYARTRLITTGERSRDRVEVLTGLRAGDRLIDGAIPDGACVEVQP